MLARRSQTYEGVDCHQWVEVGGAEPVAVLYVRINVELDASCNRELQGDKERCDMGPFGFAEDQLSCCILNHL